MSVYRDHYLACPEMTASNSKLFCFIGTLPVEELPKMKAQRGNKVVHSSLYALDCDGLSVCERGVIESLCLLQNVTFGDSEASIAELKIKFGELSNEETVQMEGRRVHSHLYGDAKSSF